jgi:hypothetical protein
MSAAATYEVHLRSTPPEALVSGFTPSRVRRTSPQTVLKGRVASQDELAGLIERVLTLGLVLDEVHELRMAPGTRTVPRRDAGPGATHRSYEVRVSGQLEEASLRFLRWEHRRLPELAALSFEASPENVHEFLNACCRLGIGIERVRRLPR